MCGIVGYIGTKKAKPILIDGLLKLEYRGYDSAGIATIENEVISVMKDKGRVKNLYNLEGIDTLEGTVGIAHTRWATHGKPLKENAHPHMDNSGTFAVVHNGIIENYLKLKKFLEKNGYKFLSKTDTEVIPNLIHYYYNNKKIDNNGVGGDVLGDPANKFLIAVNTACKDLKGSYAIEVISSLYPNTIIVARKESPLVIGKGENENYICSDIPAMLSHTRNFYLLENNEIAQISKEKVIVYNTDLEEIKKEVETIEWDVTSMEKGDYEDYMIKEISEQPIAIKETIGSKLDNEKIKFDTLSFKKEYLQSLNKIYIVACGTAMHAGLATRKTFEKFCKISVEIDVASEFRYREPLIDEKSLAIFISQSGETADTIAALKLAKRKKAKTIAISNVIGSSITREANYSIYTHAGPEIAVASTKAYTSQVVMLTLLAIYFAETLGNNPEEIQELKKDIIKLPEQIKEVLKAKDAIKEFAKKVYNEKDMFFLGRGVDYSVGLEGSLKLKEISYIHSEAYPSGELKHGPIALIENNITVIAIITDSKLVEKTLSNIQEVITRGAKPLIVTNQEMNQGEFKDVITIPNTNVLISSVLSVIPLQLFSYYISKEKGLDVDKPRNLAKSVTVE